MSLGLVIGKFLPPHRGHGLLLAAACSCCDDVIAIVCDAGWHKRTGELRAGWIAESFPGVRTIVLDQEALGLSDDDTEGWARATREALEMRPDIVFSSEDYGPGYAARLGAEHVMVDRERTVAPVSGRAIRANPQSNLEWLDPHVRAHYVTRVCVLGAESTGKTTVARDLAKHYGVGYVGEFGRHYTEAMPDPPRYRWTSRDFHLIAEAQAAIEDDTARWTASPLICDTNSFVTSVFHQAYLGSTDRALETAGQERTYDLFLLCDPTTPFAQDGTSLRRDGETRMWMHRRFCDYTESHNAPVVHLTGSPASRRDQAVEAVDRVLCQPFSGLADGVGKAP